MIASQNEARRPRLGPARRSRPEGGLRAVTDAAYPDWDAVYRDNVTWVYRLMYSKVGNQPDAEDLTAEVLHDGTETAAGVGDGAGGAQVPEDDGAHRARVLLAGPDGQADYDDQEDLPDESGQEIIESDAPDRVRQVLARLPDNYRRILELRFLQAFSVREAAGQMGVSVANAKVLQHRAIQMAAQVSEEAL